ncbi:hypothetical protein JCM17380_51380 [Desulfosporosinus burensis]
MLIINDACPISTRHPNYLLLVIDICLLSTIIPLNGHMSIISFDYIRYQDISVHRPDNGIKAEQ